MDSSNWEIPPLSVMSQQVRQFYWESIHSADYADVWSITEDIKLLNKIVETLRSLDKISRILIIGCGSRVTLQMTLIEGVKNIEEIVCVDFPGVVEIASQRTTNPKIRYQSCDLTKLSWDQEWDVIINVNAILSENHEENSLILKNCWNSLKDKGFFLGFFPTIFCALEIAHIEMNSQRLNDIDCSRSSFLERKQGVWQIFYTPLRLRKLLIDQNFLIKSFEVFFFDSEYAKHHSSKYYELKDPDLLIYEHYVILQKISGST